MESRKLNDKELEKVSGGVVPPEIRKDEYENIILRVNPEDHNVMLHSIPEEHNVMVGIDPTDIQII